MREQIIRRYVDAENIYKIIWHDNRVYIKIAIFYGSLILFFWFLYVAIIKFINEPFLKRIWWVWWALLYCKAIYDIFDEYLDTLLITDRWLVHFRRDGFWKRKADILQRVSVESVSDRQDTMRDSLLNKGDVTFTLEDRQHIFKEVDSPSSVTNSILDYKDKILWRHNYYENEWNENDARDKYEMLVEALWEVVTEYVEKKKIVEY